TDMGGGGLVITDNDQQGATDLAREIAWKYWQSRFDLDPTQYSPSEAIELGMKLEGGPILLVEASDCCGGGAAGDGVAALVALFEANLSEVALVPVVDPEAAEQCHQGGVGQEVTVLVGHKLDPKWGTPFKISGRVQRLSEGRFKYVR